MALNPRIVLKNGVSLSVQANQYAYCEPRKSLGIPWHKYKSVDVGFIEDSEGNTFEMPPEWRQYSDNGTLTSDVYGYVPVELVNKFIDDNGGQK